MHTAASPNQLVVDHLAYAEALAVDLIDQLNLRPLINLDEAISFANVALTESAHRFKSTVGRTGQPVPFKTFSFPRIRGAVIECVRRTVRSRRLHELETEQSKTLEQRTAPLPQNPARNHAPAGESRADAALEQPAFAREAEHALHREALDAFATRDGVLKAIRELPELEQQVIFLHFYEDMSCERIALRMGISGSYAQRLCKKALHSLRTSLKEFDNAGVEGALQ
jgi:RNA polymerase sigma factor (sigma-70 family)